MLAAGGQRSVKAARGRNGSLRGLRGIGRTCACAAICRPALSWPFNPRGQRGRLDLHPAYASWTRRTADQLRNLPALSRLIRAGSIDAATSRWSADGDVQKYRNVLSRFTSRPGIGYPARRVTGCGLGRTQAREGACPTDMRPPPAVTRIFCAWRAPRAREAAPSGSIAAPAAVASRDAVPRGQAPAAGTAYWMISRREQPQPRVSVSPWAPRQTRNDGALVLAREDDVLHVGPDAGVLAVVRVIAVHQRYPDRLRRRAVGGSGAGRDGRSTQSCVCG